jgi:hypothetical protein
MTWSRPKSRAGKSLGDVYRNISQNHNAQNLDSDDEEVMLQRG